MGNKIYISPYNFNQDSFFNTLHEKWLINLSDVTIPHNVQVLLQLGERFGLPMTHRQKERTIIDFIKHIEKNITGYKITIVNHVRNQSNHQQVFP